MLSGIQTLQPKVDPYPFGSLHVPWNWAPPGDGGLFPISRAGDLSGRQQLAGSDQEIITGEVGVEEYDNNPQKVGGGAAGVRIFL